MKNPSPSTTEKPKKEKKTKDSLVGCLPLSCKLRVYLNPSQHKTISHHLYYVQKFRNEAVAFCRDRRLKRNAWIRQHPLLYRECSSKDGLLKGEGIPEDISGNDAVAASKWLTERLDKARQEAMTYWGLSSGKIQLRAEAFAQWVSLSPQERRDLFEAKPDLYLVTLPRTILDQVLQDMAKTCAQAMKSRIQNKNQNPNKNVAHHQKNQPSSSGLVKRFSKAPKDTFTSAEQQFHTDCTRDRQAGWPVFQKHSYVQSIRFQVTPDRQASMKNHWEAGQIFIPGLGVIKFRDEKSLPKTPPEMITLSRNAAGQFHVSFQDRDHSQTPVVFGVLPCEDLDQEKFGQKKLNQSKKLDEKLDQELNQEELNQQDNNQEHDPQKTKFENLQKDLAQKNLNPTKIPKVTGVDASLRSQGVLSDGKTIGRMRYLRKFERGLKRKSKKLSRQTKHSKRWQKTRTEIGRIHVTITNIRDDDLRKKAKALVKDHAIVCVENLNLLSMLKNHSLAQSISDASFGKFKQFLYQEAAKLGHLVLECGRWDASSKTCHVCQEKNTTLTLQEREWTCKKCNTKHDRDVNASINIRQMALTRAINLLNDHTQSSTDTSASGNDVQRLVSYKLHPELQVFIERGGLTSVLDFYSKKSNPSQPREAFVLPQYVTPLPNGTGVM